MDAEISPGEAAAAKLRKLLPPDDIEPAPPEAPTPEEIAAEAAQAALNKAPRSASKAATDAAAKALAKAQAQAPPPPAGFKNPKQSQLARMANFLGDAVGVAIRHRNKDGSLGYIKQFAPREFDGVPNIDEFVRRFLVPQYGTGEFPISFVSPDGSERMMQSVRIEAPNEENDMSNAVVSELRDMKQALRANEPKGPTPLDNVMAKLLERQLDGSQDGGIDLNMIIALKAMNSAPPPVDNTPLLMQALASIAEKVSQPMPMPPPPLPPPAPEFTLRDLMEMQDRQRKEMQDMFREMRETSKEEMREMRGVMKEMKAAPSGLDQLRAWLAFTKESQTELGGGGGDLVKLSANVKDIVASMKQNQAAAPAPSQIAAPTPPAANPSGSGEIPPGFADLCTKIAIATDDAHRIESTWDCFLALIKHGTLPAGYLEQLRTLCIAKDTAGARALLVSFLDGLRDRGHLEPVVRDRALQAFDNGNNLSLFCEAIAK